MLNKICYMLGICGGVCRVLLKTKPHGLRWGIQVI